MRNLRWMSLFVALAPILAGQSRQSFNWNRRYGVAPVAETAARGLPVKAIAASGQCSIAVAADGSVWEWGGKSSVPVRVSGLTDVVAAASSSAQALALKDDQTVWSWQPGGGSPAQVGGLTAVTAVAASPSGDHFLALRNDGTVWAWVVPGYFSASSSTPAPVGGLSLITAIASGYDYSLAVKFDGTVWQWNLQYGSVSPYWETTARQVSGLSGVVAVAAAGSLGIALKGNGTVWEWQASNMSGSPPLSSIPPAQVEGLSDMTSIAGSISGGHRLALKRDGTVWAWGQNVRGQLGNGTTSSDWSQSSPPVQVTGLSGVTAIAAGYDHSLALGGDGSLWAWGGDYSGQLGRGALMTRAYAVQVGGLGGVTSVAAGQVHSMALKSDGTVWQWGAPGGMALSMSPAPVSDLTDVVTIAATWLSAAVTRDGTVWQWPTPYAPVPTPIEGLADALAVSGTGQVVLKRDGSVWQLTGYPAQPVQVPGLKGVVAVASASTGYNLALTKDGTVWQWGMWYDDWYDPSQSPQPDQVFGLTGITAIAAGDIAAALKSDGTVWEWYGRAMPGQRPGVNNITAVAVGSGHSIALKSDGTVWTWGQNDNGQLGDGTASNRNSPVQVAGLTGVKAIAAGGGHTLAVKRDGSVWSWGDNRQGQLGGERMMFESTPVPVIPPGAPDLAIAMSHKGDFTVGEQAVYTLTVTNVGHMATTGMIQMTDTLPPGLTWLTAEGSDWGCSAADQVVTCMSPVQIEPGASSTIGLIVEVGAAAWPGVTNLAVVSNETDLNPCNDAMGDPTVVSGGRT